VQVWLWLFTAVVPVTGRHEQPRFDFCKTLPVVPDAGKWPRVDFDYGPAAWRDTKAHIAECRAGKDFLITLLWAGNGYVAQP